MSLAASCRPQPTKPPRLTPLVLGLLLAAGAPAEARAQGITYTSVSELELGGGLGAAANLLGAGGPTEETTWIEGPRMRTDSEGTSTIADFEAGRVIWMDHERKTYSAMTIAGMMEAAKAAGDTMAAEARAAGADATGASDGSESVRWEFDLNVQPTGRVERIAGFEAEQVILVLLAEAIGTDQETGETGSMQMAFVNDLWVSEEPEAFMQELGEAASAEMRAGAGGMTGMEGVLAGDPRMREGMRRAQEEAEKIDGMPLRSVSHVVLLPPGQALDLESALAGAKAKGPDVAAAAKDAVADRIGGLFGRKKKEEAPTEPAPQQSTLLTVTTLVKDMRTGPVPAGTFEIPEGYREVELGSGG